MPRTVQLSVSGLTARIAPDGLSDDGHILDIGGAEQSHVNGSHPENIFYEYLRRIGSLVDLLGQPGQPITAAHLGAGALTLARYIQVSRPGSLQVAVDIERELFSLVLEELPLPEGTRLQTVVGDVRASLPALLPALGASGVDAVILDIFSGRGAPAHLTEEGFYREIHGLLSPSGLLAVNVGDDPGLSFFSAQAQIMLAVFDRVWCLTEEPMLSGRRAGNLILVGSGRTLDPQTRKHLLAAGPHPAAVLDTYELGDFLASLTGGKTAN